MSLIKVAIIKWLANMFSCDNEEKMKWERIPFKVRFFNAMIFAVGFTSMFASIIDLRFLLVGLPIMFWGCYQEHKFDGYPFDVNKYQ